MNRLFLLLFGAVSLVAHAQVPDYVPTDGLVAWYPFNGNANDESGNGNDGVNNGATSTMDRFSNENSAYYFSGSGCSTRIDANVNTESINGQITISIWTSRSGSGCAGPRVFEAWPGSNSEGHLQIAWDNNYEYPQGFTHRVNGTYGPDGLSTSEFSAVANDQWTQIVYTNDGTLAFLYQDGVLKSVGANQEGAIITMASNVAIGRMNHPAYDALNGKVDDIGIWNRALTECEIAALYAAESSTTVSVSGGADLSICLGDSIVLSASGGDSTYTWSNGIEDGVAFVPDSSSYFTVEGSLGACTSTDTVFVEVLQPSTGMDTQVVCDSLTWIDGITYTASTNEPSIALTNAAGCDSIVTLDLTVNYTTYNTIDTTVVNVLEYNGEEYTEGGEYLVYLENEAGCDSIITLKLTLEYVGVDDLETQGNWSVYPNPIESQLTISSANALESYLVQIFNALGQVIWSERVSNQVTIEVYGWPRGMYVIEIQGEGVETRERLQIVLK